MDEEQIRTIIRDELKELIKSDRFTFYKLIQILDGRKIMLGTTTGTMIGTAITQKLGLWNTTPIVQPSAVGEANGFTAGAGTTVTHVSTFTGNSGTKAYNISDIVKHLKAIGILASS